MKLKTPSKTAVTEYVTAPWSLRLRWWVAARLWRWGQDLEELAGGSPDLANPLWRR